jgi:hypothetical protein
MVCVEGACSKPPFEQTVAMQTTQLKRSTLLFVSQLFARMVVYCMHLLRTPSIKHGTLHNNYLYILNVFAQLPFNCEFIFWLYNHFPWWNCSETSVIVIVLLFIPPWRWPHKRPKHVWGYLVYKITSNYYCCAFVAIDIVFIWLMHGIWTT